MVKEHRQALLQPVERGPKSTLYIHRMKVDVREGKHAEESMAIPFELLGLGAEIQADEPAQDQGVQGSRDAGIVLSQKKDFGEALPEHAVHRLLLVPLGALTPFVLLEPGVQEVQQANAQIITSTGQIGRSEAALLVRRRRVQPNRSVKLLRAVPCRKVYKRPAGHNPDLGRAVDEGEPQLLHQLLARPSFNQSEQAEASGTHSLNIRVNVPGL